MDMRQMFAMGGPPTNAVWQPYAAPMSDMTTPDDLARQTYDATWAHAPPIIEMMSGYRPSGRESVNVEDQRSASSGGPQSYPSYDMSPIPSGRQQPTPQSGWMPTMDEMLPQSRRY